MAALSPAPDLLKRDALSHESEQGGLGRMLTDDTDEDASQLLTVICDGDPRCNRGFDLDAYRMGGIA
jgi:hypothetical protein